MITKTRKYLCPYCDKNTINISRTKIAKGKEITCSNCKKTLTKQDIKVWKNKVNTLDSLGE